MSKTTQTKRKPLLRDALDNLRGNRHFETFLEAMDVECAHGKTIFKAEPCQNAFGLGRQSFANDVHQHLESLDKASK